MVLKKIDESIQRGEGKSARELLNSLKKKDLPRGELARVASLAWRAGSPELGLKLLNPIVRAPAKKPANPTPEEKAEYAACLIRVGASQEALSLLTQPDLESASQRQLYRAFAHISRWEYAESIPLLESYLAAAPTPYQALVGKVNLAAALTHERRHDEAEKVLETVRESTRAEFHLLHGNALQLSAANRVLERKFDEAEKLLAEAERRLRNATSPDEFLVRKWKVAARFLESPREAKSRHALKALRREALGREHWETLRDCDRFEAVALELPGLARHLYFGTPYASFRARLLEEFPQEFPDRYEWRLGDGEAAAIAAKAPPQGKLLFRLMMALTSDFYRPHRQAALYHTLFPDEFFNPLSSPHRIHEANRRLRLWFHQEKIPLEIREHAGAYSLVASAPCRIEVPRPEMRDQWIVPPLARLREMMGADFSLSEATSALHGSSRSTLRLLQEGMTSGELERLGSGKKTRYRFVYTPRSAGKSGG